jgi:hypothetical protein
MIRVVAENLLLFLTPAFLYFAYVLIARAPEPGPSEGSRANSAEHLFEGAPYISLFFAGTALVILTLLAFGSNSGGKPGQQYEPPTMKDGHIEPGHMQ